MRVQVKQCMFFFVFLTDKYNAWWARNWQEAYLPAIYTLCLCNQMFLNGFVSVSCIGGVSLHLNGSISCRTWQIEFLAVQHNQREYLTFTRTHPPPQPPAAAAPSQRRRSRRLTQCLHSDGLIWGHLANSRSARPRSPRGQSQSTSVMWMMMTGSKSEGDGCHGAGEEKSLIEVNQSEEGGVCVCSGGGRGCIPLRTAPQLGSRSSITPADGPRWDGDGWTEMEKSVEGAEQVREGARGRGHPSLWHSHYETPPPSSLADTTAVHRRCSPRALGNQGP